MPNVVRAPTSRSSSPLQTGSVEQMDRDDQAKNRENSDSEGQPKFLSDSERLRKRNEVEIACNARDVVELARLSTTPGGFIDDELRSRACTTNSSYVSILIRR